MAGTALAIQLYVLDHGRRPETLAQLLPDYVAEVPRDPFSAEGAVLLYRPDASPPVLYSVGMDGKDNVGVQTLRSGGRIDLDRSDLPFFLDGKVGKPADSSSTQTRSNNQNAQDDGGQTNDNHSGQYDPK